MVAEVIINSIAKSLNRIFDYNIPMELNNSIQIGSRVVVPFGFSKKTEEGFVIGIKDTSEYSNKIKDIIRVQEGYNLTQESINLAKWMSKRYFCNISECIKMMLPPGTSTKILENRVAEKTMNFVYLKKGEDEIDFDNIKSDKQTRALKFLIDNNNEGVLTTDLEMFVDVSRAVINTLVKNGYLEIVEKQVERNPFLHKDIKGDTDLKLTDEQQNAFDTIKNSMNKFKEFLIYGVTGSRKNRDIFATYKTSFANE